MPTKNVKGFIVTMTIDSFHSPEFTPNKSAGPLYRQIADSIASRITSGVLKPGEKLPTHRALADQLEVTVGTITRAYGEAERRGLVEARVGAGTFVRDGGKNGWLFFNSNEKDTCELGYNVPPALDRSEMMRQAMTALTQDGREINQMLLYQSAEGFMEHRERVVSWLAMQDTRLDVSRVLLTSGAQNAIQLVLSALSRAGDTLLVESLTYPGLINLARQQQITLKPVAMDEQGMLPESLDNACRQYQPKLLYAMPTFQNPTTAVMGEQRRREILAVCRRHGVYLIEDYVNGLLPEHRPPAMVALDDDIVIHIGAFSKFLAPGLRVGYMQVPEALYKRMVMTVQNQCWMISPLLTGLACELIEQGFADQTLETIRTDIRQREQLARHYLGAAGIRTTRDCFHTWLPLPESWSLSDFLAACSKANVSLKSGELFVPPGHPIPQAVRLSISGPHSHQALERGLQTVQGLFAERPVTEFAL